MSTRDRSRYMTTAGVFLAAFLAIGLLSFRSIRVMAQGFTYRPTVATSNTYADSVAATQRLNFAYDENVNSAAVTYTNADFEDNGATADTSFDYSGRWSIFDQTTTLLENVGLYVVRDGSLNAANQWKIQYSIDGVSGTYYTLDDDSISGANPSKGTVSTMTIPDDLDLETDLVVRTYTRQENTTDARINMYDIRVEADFDTSSGGSYYLRIDTVNLPDGVQNVAYGPELIEASGGNTPYDWCRVDISGEGLPTGMSLVETGTANTVPDCPSTRQSSPDIQLTGTPTGAGPYTFTVRVSDATVSETETDDQTFDITILGLAISPTGPTLTPAQKGAAYGGVTFTPVGGGSPYYWCMNGSIPPGMTIKEDGGANDPETCPDDGSGDPEQTAAYQAGNIQFGGTPTNDGVYSFTLKLRDTTLDQVATHAYQITVGSVGVTLQPKKLKDHVKGIPYGTGSTDIEPEFLVASGIDSTGGSAGAVTTSTGSLPSGLSYNPSAVATTISGGMRINLEGTVAVTTASGEHAFTTTITDPGNPTGASDTEDYTINVLKRETLLIEAPSSAVVLKQGIAIDYSSPSNEDQLEVGDTLLNSSKTGVSATVIDYDAGANRVVVAAKDISKWPAADSLSGPGSFSATISTSSISAYLTFTLAGAGGAPSTDTYSTGGTAYEDPCNPSSAEALDGKKVARYRYYWLVSPVGSASALATNAGVTPNCGKAGPHTLSIEFTDANGNPVTGEYDVVFWAEDKVARDNPPDAGGFPPLDHPSGVDTNDDEEFIPAEVRVSVISPEAKTLEQDAGRPTKLRQEQLR